MLVFVAVVVCCSIFFTFTSIQTVIKAGETNAAEMKSSEATEEGKQLIVKKAETADAAANAKEKEVIHINTTAAGAGLLLIEDELVKLDNNSTLAPDIINITHVRNGNEEESNMIVIHLKQERRCKTPQLVGRLSGPALSKVTWEKVHEDDHEAFLVGHYDVPVPGRFFIEIITTMCNELEYDIDFQPICLEDPTRHRLTHKDASIDAVPLRGGAHIHSNENPAGIIGYWHHTNITKREKPVPLYTRYQPRGCRQPEDLISARCEEATDVSRFDPYEFQFATDIRLQNRLEKKEDTVCFIGASHALHLTVRAQKILKERNILSVTAKTMKGFQFAREYTEEEIQWINDQHCTKVIIGIGQWDASYWADMEYEGNAPTLFQEYEDDLKKAMAIMVDIFRDNNVDLYFRTTQ